MATKTKKTWKDRVGSALRKTELMINPIKQAQFSAKVGMNLAKKVKGNKNVQNLLNKAGETASTVGKKVTKTVQNVNPKSEINQKINKKKAEIAKGNVKAKSQLSALQRKKSGKSISDVRAENERKMRENAKKRHEAWKAKRKKNRK